MIYNLIFFFFFLVFLPSSVIRGLVPKAQLVGDGLLWVLLIMSILLCEAGSCVSQ